MTSFVKNLLLIASLTLNLVLGYRILTDAPEAPPEPTGGSEQHAPQTPALAPRPSPPMPPLPGDGAPAPEIDSSTFTLGDYLAYLEQLEDRKLSDEAIKRIMLGSIEEQYGWLEERERAQTPYWKMAQRDDLEWVEQQLLWDEEKRQLLLSLFGEEARDDPLFARLFKPLGEKFDFLTSDKQIAVYEIEQRRRARAIDMRGGPLVRETVQDLQRANAALVASIQELLTPDEFFEYQLRESRLSDMMRRSMAGFDYSEQEFRELFRIRQETQFNMTGGEPTAMITRDNRAGMVAAREAADQRVREYLGDTRYEELAKSQDPLYRSLSAIGERYGNSSAEVDAVYALTQQYREQIDSIRTDTTLTQEQRMEALARINEEMPERIERLVGPDAAASVRDNVGRMLFGRPFRRRGGS